MIKFNSYDYRLRSEPLPDPQNEALGLSVFLKKDKSQKVFRKKKSTNKLLGEHTSRNSSKNQSTLKPNKKYYSQNVSHEVAQKNGYEQPKLDDIKVFLSNLAPTLKLVQNPQMDRKTYFNNFKLSKKAHSDSDFRPNFSQIVGKDELSFPNLKKRMTFKRLNSYFNDARFVYSNEFVDDWQIYPGYFHSKLLILIFGVLNENRKILKRIFLKKLIDASSTFVVNLFIDNQWEPIQIDDFLPLIEDKYFFSICNKKEAWPSLLEKTLAKILGSYLELEKISNLDNLIRICTGLFSKRYFFRTEMAEDDFVDYLGYWVEMVKIGHILVIKTKQSDDGVGLSLRPDT